jgi:hypothetical protein
MKEETFEQFISGSQSKSFRASNPHLFSGPDSTSPPPKTGKRLRQSTKPLMNKLEQEFKDYMEDQLCHAYGDSYCELLPQALRFRLGNGIWYKPDFIFVNPLYHTPKIKLLAYEVKGPKSWRGGFENLKIAATLYEWVEWILVWKDNALWRTQLVYP